MKKHLRRKDIFRIAEAKARNKSLINLLNEIPDPRDKKNRKYPLTHVLIVILFGFSCGCTNVVAACVESRYIRKALKRYFKIEEIPAMEGMRREKSLLSMSRTHLLSHEMNGKLLKPL